MTAQATSIRAPQAFASQASTARAKKKGNLRSRTVGHVASSSKTKIPQGGRNKSVKPRSRKIAPLNVAPKQASTISKTSQMVIVAAEKSPEIETEKKAVVQMEVASSQPEPKEDEKKASLPPVATVIFQLSLQIPQSMNGYLESSTSLPLNLKIATVALLSSLFRNGPLQENCKFTTSKFLK